MTEPRKKRFQVYSHTDTGNPLLVESFDLREQAEQFISRRTDDYYNAPKDLMLRKPRFVLVDARANTMEGLRGGPEDEHTGQAAHDARG